MWSKSIIRWHYVLIVLAVLTEVTPAVRAQVSREVARKVLPSVVVVWTKDQDGQPLAMGSGFFVADRVVASNFHVIEKASRASVSVPGTKGELTVESVLGVDRTNDLVLLSVPAGHGPVLKLGDSKGVAVGDEIFAVGSPEGLAGTFSQGVVSSLRTFGARRFIQITAPISPGSSGGPVLNSSGEVVAVSVMYFREGQNLNFAVPVDLLGELLNEKGPATSVAAVGQAHIDRQANDGFGEPGIGGVVARRLDWGEGSLRFSLLNRSDHPVRRINYLMAFYDERHEPLQWLKGRYVDVLPAGLANWSDLAILDRTTARICDTTRGGKGSVEIRILSFDVDR